LRKRIRETVHLAWYTAMPDLKDPTWLFFSATVAFMPVLFLAIFVGVGGAVTALPGVLVLSLTTAGMGSAPLVYFNRTWFRLQDFLVGSPMRPVSYAVGMALYTVFATSPGIVLSMGLLGVFHGATALGVLTAGAALLLLWGGFLFVGFAIGLTARTVTRANSVPTLLGLMLGLLPPVYYPLSRLPPTWQPIGLLIPTTDAAQLVRTALGFQTIPVSQALFEWGYLLTFGVLGALFASRFARWVDR
jgi:ABC-2 type transport system permease protein